MAASTATSTATSTHQHDNLKRKPSTSTTRTAYSNAQFFLRMILIFAQMSGAFSSRLPLEVFTHRPEHMLQSGVTSTNHNGRIHAHFDHSARTHGGKLAHLRQQEERGKLRILYQVGSNEESLPICRPRAVCSKVDLYDSSSPWLERQCRCPASASTGQPGHCPTSASADDGHTLVDKTRHYKMCEPVKRLPKCRYFRDTTWTLTTLPDANMTEQVVHCHCPRNAVTYLIKRHQVYKTPTGEGGSQVPQTGYQYEFACSPQSRLRCQRKEPCRLFTVRKRQEFLDEVNTSTLCQCPREHRCPRHHTDPGSIPGKSYTEEAIRTYSGYCMPS